MNASPKVHFCPFCGNGTLLLGSERHLFKCLKCQQKFQVGYVATPSAEELGGRCPCALGGEHIPGFFHGPHGHPMGTRSPDRT